MDRHTKYEREEKKTVHLGEDARKKNKHKTIHTEKRNVHESGIVP